MHRARPLPLIRCDDRIIPQQIHQPLSASGAARGRPTMSTRVQLTRRVIAALLMVLLTACQTWQPITARPQTPPSSMRVTMTNGEIITLSNPTITTDSIIGATDIGVARLATRDIRLVEVRNSNAGGSIGLGLLAVAVVFLAAAAKCAGGGTRHICRCFG